MAPSTQPASSTASSPPQAYLFGMPIMHSISPRLHNTVSTTSGLAYRQILHETHDLSSAIDMLKADPLCLGSGVTMPYKVSVIPYLDDLTPAGRTIGAINTIYLSRPNPSDPSDVRYIGTNTDCIGIRDAFLSNVPNPSTYLNKPGLIIGGGGTSRAAIYTLQNFMQCNPIYIVNRDPSEVSAVLDECISRGISANSLIHVSSVSQAQLLPTPGAVLSAIPNFTPQTQPEHEARNIVTEFLSRKSKGAIVEMCYHPSPVTQISELAQSHGWQVIFGTEAMIGQGLEQAKLWTGLEITEEIRANVRETIHHALQKMQQQPQSTEHGIAVTTNGSSVNGDTSRVLQDTIEGTISNIQHSTNGNANVNGTTSFSSQRRVAEKVP